ncbi:MAG: hypothetical protein H6838_00325 [Planctomycetes bacterium]|nr:hypothetical protein [Planctomycetota bacterium]
MPSAIRHDHELSSKGLVSILMERQGSNEAQLESFMWQRFPENDCYVCIGGFVPTPPSSGIPHGALIGVDGKLLWSGHPLSDAKQISELIDAELDKVKKGWGDTAEARKVRAALYGKNSIGSAQALVAAMAEGEERTALQTEIDRRYASQKKAVATLQEDGRWIDAQDACKALAKSVGKHENWEPEIAELLASFDSDAGKAELAVDKKYAKVVKMLRDKKSDAAPKAIEAVLKKAEGTKVGARAQRTLTALKTEPR